MWIPAAEDLFEECAPIDRVTILLEGSFVYTWHHSLDLAMAERLRRKRDAPAAWARGPEHSTVPFEIARADERAAKGLYVVATLGARVPALHDTQFYQDAYARAELAHLTDEARGAGPSGGAPRSERRRSGDHPGWREMYHTHTTAFPKRNDPSRPRRRLLAGARQRGARRWYASARATAPCEVRSPAAWRALASLERCGRGSRPSSSLSSSQVIELPRDAVHALCERYPRMAAAASHVQIRLLQTQVGLLIRNSVHAVEDKDAEITTLALREAVRTSPRVLRGESV